MDARLFHNHPAEIEADRTEASFLDILSRLLQDNFPDSHFFYTEILDVRPEFNAIADEFPKSVVIVNFILWAWEFGCREEERVAIHEYSINKTIRALYTTTHPEAKCKAYNMLMHCIWLLRKDLHTMNAESLEGQRELMLWFMECGMAEYNLQPALFPADVTMAQLASNDDRSPVLQKKLDYLISSHQDIKDKYELLANSLAELEAKCKALDNKEAYYRRYAPLVSWL